MTRRQEGPERESVAAVSLKIAEAESKDVGRGLARLDPQDLERMGAHVGDILEVQGKKTTVVKAMPAFKERRGQGILQIDGLIRSNAVSGLGDRVVWVRGNADRELVQLARGEGGDIPDPIAPWAASQLSADHVDWLAGLPYPVTLPVDGFGPVVFCHATPRDDDPTLTIIASAPASAAAHLLAAGWPGPS